MIRELLTREIIELKKKRKLSQKEFAKAIGLSQGYMSRLENGKFYLKIEQIESACDFLKISILQLFKDAATEYPHDEQITTDNKPAWIELFEGLSSVHQERIFGIMEGLRIAETETEATPTPKAGAGQKRIGERHPR